MARMRKMNRHVGIFVETEDTWGRNIFEFVRCVVVESLMKGSVTR